MSRRTFIAGVGATGALAWARVDRVAAAELAGCVVPPALPPGIELTKRRFETWSGEIAVDDVWTATATAPAEVVALANWAWQQGWVIRAGGHRHNFSPLTITADQGCDARVIVVDTAALSSLAMASGSTVRAGAGTSLEDLLRFLDANGKGLSSVPAVGLVTLGGVLAIDGHGAAVPAVGEVREPGDGYGSLSNQVVALTAVVWDATAGAYVLRTFGRATPEGAALTTHLGRAFLTEVVLRVGPARNLRCRSTFDQPTSVVFASPRRAGPHSFGRLLDQSGRVESILFPFTDKPWTKTWTVTPSKPMRSRATTGPYPFTFSDSIPVAATDLLDQVFSGPGPHHSMGEDLGPPLGDLADRVLRGEAELTPLFGRTGYAVSRAAVLATMAGDLWGPAFHTQLYIKETTLRFGQLGIAMLTSRANVQRVAHLFTSKLTSMMGAHRAAGLYPLNGPLELRACGVDHPDVAQVAGADAPLLSAVRARADHPEWDTALWANVMAFPGTEGSYELFTELEQWIRATLVAPLACVRAEWSKGWAYTPDGPWTSDETLTQTIPADYPGWETARATLNALDPHRIYSNAFLDRLLP